MKWFYDLKIAAKLIAGFIMVALIAGIIGYMGITKINLIDQADTELYKNNTRPLADIGQVAKSFQRIRVNLRDIIIEKDNSDCQKYADTIKELNQGIDKLLPSYEKSLSSSEDRQQFANLQEGLTKFEPVQAKIIELALAHKESEALALMRGEGLIQAQAIEQSIDKLMEINTAQASATADSNTAAAQAAERTMIILIVIGVLMALALGFFISRIISNPVHKLVDAADKLALGDVNVQVEANSKDEIGTLAKSFAAMVENIRSQALVAEKIAAGDMSVQVNVRSQDDLLGIKLSEMLENLKMIISEMNLMYEEQKAGDIDVYIPIDKFSGAYRQMTDGVNQMVKLHVDVILKVLGVITSYAEGDFTPVLEKLPGKQVIANEKLDLIRNNLLNLINEILTLTKAATTGQLNTRADASRYSGDYARIVQGINNILDAIVAPLQDTIAVLNEMAQGNLCTGITSDLQGDYAKIKNAVNDTLQAFNEVLGQINEAAGQVASGSGQVSSSSQALSQASTEQASSVEEITATMTQISAQTKQNALNANQANELATNAKENAVKGNQEMQEMLKSMGEINDASANISKIIKVIDEIAFQTNILALNAAVEAARAGQHGKGFAVVAEEVRNLAARSANAAKETTVMIEGSIDKVEMGTRMANETAGALNKIVEGVTTVADLVGDIAGASNEQATAIAQVNQGIAGVAEVTQMNTATAQQSAAASEELASQAELLKDQVDRFKLQKAGASMHNLNEMSPDIIKMIENMIEKRQPVHAESHEGVRKETAPRPKAQIALDDSDFGKY